MTSVKATKRKRHFCGYPNGDTYVGQLDENGNRNGFGRYVHVEDILTKVGEWKDGELDGYGWIHWPEDDEVYEGQLKNGARHGYGTTSCKQWLYRGMHANNAYHGFGEEVIVETGVRYKGYYKQDKRHGHGTMWTGTGIAHEGEWLDGALHGAATLRYPDQSVLTCTYDHGRIEGPATWRWRDGSVWEGNITKGTRSGPGRHFWPNEEANELHEGDPFANAPPSHATHWPDGVFFVGNYENDHRIGLGTTVGPTGVLKATYVADERLGPATFAWSNGDRWEGEFTDHEESVGTKTLADGTHTTGKWLGFDISPVWPVAIASCQLMELNT